jgi:16S rRNA (guanine527-N7)-methyltransferase
MAAIGELGLTLDDSQLRSLGDYLARLLAMNTQMNLTAIIEPDEAWMRHALDALALVPHLGAGKRIVDVGTGGGVPGIPLAIACPDRALTLVDATQKKVTFLADVSRALGLSNVVARAGRAEVLGVGPLAGVFDVVTARALARLAVLVPLLAPFAAPRGKLLLIKGQKADEELAEAAPAITAAGLVHVQTVVGSTGRVVILARA